MDIKLNYVERGDGFPLILLHGNGEDYTYFKNQMEPFSKYFRVIIPETRGHGSSPRGTAPFTIEQFAEDLKEFLDEKGITKCHLLGFSDGANVALQFAMKYPEYLEKLVFNSGNLSPSGIKQDFQAPYEERWKQLGVQSPLEGEDLKEWELLGLFVDQPHFDAKALTALPMPALVIAGEDDVIQREHTELIADLIPDSRIKILPGDHFVADCNWKEYNDAVLDFLVNA